MNPNCPNSKCDHMVNPPCKMKQSTQMPSKTTKAMNHSAWEGHSNEKKFMDALTNLMNESWTVVCQMREKSGLNPQYQMSNAEISKRIEIISKKLEEKYKEVAALEEHKSKLLNKTTIATGVQSPARRLVPPSRQPGYPPARQTGTYGAVGANSPPYGSYGACAPSSSSYGVNFPPSYGARLPVSAAGNRKRANCRTDCEGSRNSPEAYGTF